MRRTNGAILSLLVFSVSILANSIFAEGVAPGATAAVVMDSASPRVAMLKRLHLLVAPVGTVEAALDGSRYRLAIIDGTPANLLALQQHAKALDQFTQSGGWIMLWGVTPEGLATFDQIVGVDHIMRPFRMEKVAATAMPSTLSAGIVSSDLHMESSKRTPEPAGVAFLSDDAWSYVVDLEDIAPFCQLPPPAYWGDPHATLGGDHWPGNMVNGIDDYWRFSFTIPLAKPKFTDWTMKLPRPEAVDGFSIERESLFSRVTKVHLAFPGTSAKPMDLDVTQDARQDFDFPPVTTDSVEISLETDGKNKAVTGVRTIRLKVQRSPEYAAHVRPLASIGVLVAYLRGNGGIVLNEMNVPATEDIPANDERKLTVLGALLRNVHGPFDPSVPAPPRKVEWLQKGTAWEDPGNWSVGAVPGIGDIACFPAAHDSVAQVNPVISKAAEVGGLEFDDDYGGPPSKGPLAPGVKSMNQLIPSWVLDGNGMLSLGASGINVIGHRGSDRIHCGLTLAAPQTWHIGPSLAEQLTWIRDAAGNRFNLVLTGALSGGGHWTKDGVGRVYYASDTSPTFTGGLTVRGASVEWALTKLAAPGTFQFGTGSITLDNGSFCFGANNSPSKDTAVLTTPIFVTDQNGILEYAAETTPTAPMSPPLTRYTGSIGLGGSLKLGHSTIGMGISGLDLVGPVTLEQSAPSTLGVAMGDFVTGWTVFPPMRGDIHDGPGTAGNPLVLRSLINTFLIAGAHNDYAEDTVIDTCGNRMFSGSADALVVAGPGAALGKGAIRLLPGAHLNLSDAGNTSGNSSVEMMSDVASQCVLGLAYNGIPRISPASTGVLAIETNQFDAIHSLADVGDGTMRLGTFHGGAFTGKSLAPGVGNLYRLGGGGSNRARGAGPLDIQQPVLVGSAGLEVGSTAWWGNGYVRLSGANTFSGPLTAQGPSTPSEYDLNLVTVIEGMAQPAPGASPFGSPQGQVNLDDSVLQFTGVAGAQPAAKGLLNFDGHSAIQLDGDRGPAHLAFDDLHRQGNAILTIRCSSATALGTSEQLHVSGWNQSRQIVDPFILSVRANGNSPPLIDFVKFDKTMGILPFDGYVTDAGKAQPGDVLQLAPMNFTGQAIRVADLKTTGPITGKGSIALSGGGLIARGGIQPDLDFGDAEGMIFGPCNLAGKVSGKNGLTFANPIFAGRINSSLQNPANDFTGPVTVDGMVLAVQLDTQTRDGKDRPGSLGSLANNITLNGGFLSWDSSSNQTELAASRTVTLGRCGGGFYFGSDSSLSHIRAKITGPGMLTQFIEEGRGLVIDNPDNDYAGGTKICAGMNFGMTVGPQGKLGVGPVVLDPESMLVLQGDRNIDSRARLEVALGSTVRCYSGAPSVGSLTGAGMVYLHAAPRTVLTVGGDDSNFAFYGSILDADSSRGSVNKVGSGVWTLFGHQRYAGPTTITAGVLDLRGALDGGVIVTEGAALCVSGTIAGDLQFQPTSKFIIAPASDAAGGPRVIGKATLDGTMTVQFDLPPGSKADRWTVLTAQGGIAGKLPQAPKGYQLKLDAAGTTMELIRQ